MPTAETFLHAPITEALIDIRTELPPEISLDILSSFHNEIKEEFPDKKKRQMWAGVLELKPGENPQVKSDKSGLDGFLFRSEKGQKIVQARLDGFTFNKLKPYQSWEIFSEEAKVHWERFVRLAKPKKITRIALRYINRIEVPYTSSEIDLEKYLNTYPVVPPSVDCTVSNFLMRLMLENKKIDAKALVHQTVEEARDKLLPIILDIDASMDSSFELNNEILWEKMSKLRDFKNSIFFESITEETKELFR